MTATVPTTAGKSKRDKPIRSGASVYPEGDEAQANLTQAIEIDAPVRSVFQLVSTVDGLGRWWSSYITGPDPETGEAQLKWPHSGHHARVRLSMLEEPGNVVWSVLEHRPMKEWDGTSIRISLKEDGSNKTNLRLVHIGLTPESECFQNCSAGWEYLVGLLKKVAEQGFA